jgi:hypothetical protein
MPAKSGWARRERRQERFDDGADGALLGHNEHPRTSLPGSQALKNMARHGAPVVGDQDTILLSGEFQEVRIFGSAQASRCS